MNLRADICAQTFVPTIVHMTLAQATFAHPTFERIKIYIETLRFIHTEHVMIRLHIVHHLEAFSVNGPLYSISYNYLYNLFSTTYRNI
jgi:hypothetical protein